MHNSAFDAPPQIPRETGLFFDAPPFPRTLAGGSSPYLILSSRRASFGARMEAWRAEDWRLNRPLELVRFAEASAYIPSCLLARLARPLGCRRETFLPPSRSRDVQRQCCATGLTYQR